ncbi:MAG: hypothetical protein JWP52_4678, partial [Rhizobacter sp.]|nr:hypothetical protein [Rhizobacter sp.]
LTPLTITTDNAAISHVYDGSQRTAVPGIVFTESLAPGHLFGSASYNGKNVGVYTAIDGHYSDQQGYDITYVHHGSLTITPAPLTASLVGVSKTYDGSTAATLGAGNFMFSGFIDGEGATATATGTYNSKNVIDANSVGTSLLEGDFTAAPETLLGNYSLPTTAAGSGFITPKSVDVSATASNKVYDAGTLVDAHLAVSGVLENDSAGVTGTARFADKNAGTGKQVTVSDIALSGPDAGNYAVSTPSVLTVADITPKPISVAATGIDKTYDGNTKATAAMTSDGVIAGDSIDFDADASFADKNAGADKRVSVNNIRGAGPDAGNYLLLNTSGKTTAGIARKAITVDASSADKTYDGTTAASVALGSGGVVEGDAVSFSGMGAFTDKNAGADKRVSVSGIATAGDDSANYLVLDTTAATTATITPKAITVDATGIAKTYDGTLTGSVLLRANGVIEGDSVSFDGSATFADKNVGVGKALVVGGISGTGADAANYAYGSTTSTTADITPRALTVTLKGLVAKIADGSTDAVLGGGHFNVAGVVDGESVGISQTAGTFDTGATGSGKLVTTSLSLADYLAGGNTSLGNYFLFTGDLSDAIGSILPPLAFTSALASLPNIPSGAGPGNRLVATASSPDDSVADKADLDALAPALASAVSGNTKENLLLRRTFSIGDGGIRLPQGVRGSEKDASQ